MTKDTYKFNPETLSYENKPESKIGRILRFLLAVFIPAIVIAAALIFLLPYFTQTPKQKALLQEKQLLEKHYSQLLEKKKMSDEYLNEIKMKDRQIYKQIFEAQLEDPAQKQRDIYEEMKQIKPKKYSQNNSELLDSMNRVLDNINDETLFLERIVKSQGKELDFIPAIQPIYNPNISVPVYGFGTLIDPVYKTPAFHQGIDFAAPQGTPVFAAAHGKVKFAGRKRAKGLMVELDHGNGYITQYAHLSKIKAGTYSNIERGEVIGYVGNTGKSFIEHLHYEIQFEGIPVNPVNYFFLDLNIKRYSQMQEIVMRAGISLD